MKKKWTLLLIATCALTLCACGGSVSTGNQKLENAVYTNDYISLAPYTDLKATKNIYTVTDKAVENEISSILSDYEVTKCTDEFLKETLGYDSYDEFKKAVSADLAEQYKEESSDKLKEDLLKQVIDASSVLSYTDSDYQKAYDYVKSDYEAYADMFGQSLDELYDSFEMTEDDVKQEAKEQLYRTLVVDAIAAHEKITLNDTEYQEGVDFYTAENGYDSAEEFLKDYSEAEIRDRLVEDKVLDFLVAHAEVTEAAAEHE